jgi:hypothetical protein
MSPFSQTRICTGLLILSGVQVWAARTVVYENYLPWQQLHIIPVIHNLECFQVPSMIDALDGIRCCTVSLRHESALSSLKDLAEQFGPYCDVGVSTVVSTNQVQSDVIETVRKLSTEI